MKTIELFCISSFIEGGGMRQSVLSLYKQIQLIKLFMAVITARTASRLVGLIKDALYYYF